MSLHVRDLVFESDFVDSLPADGDRASAPHKVLEACYSFAACTRAPAPRLLDWQPAVAGLLGLNADAAREPEFTERFVGNVLGAGSQPYAMCYGGHQFGQWAGQLGDGRAITLGEVAGVDGSSWSLQLKGAGPTPYSRRGDGYAVLRSSLREYVASEAMFALGVPTTRALALITRGDSVVRDEMYDGRPQLEPAAVVTRVARSFLRFGNYEIFAARDDVATLQRLLDFTLRTCYPELAAAGDNCFAEFFHEVCRRTARLMVHWQRVGFVHGVMNTDNMSILGLTIDYGPFGFLDSYDAQWTPNTTDAGQRRYAFGRQMDVAAWNLSRLAMALQPVIPEVDVLQAGLDLYYACFETEFAAVAAAKLGFAETLTRDPACAGRVGALWTQLESVWTAGELDMTIFFRRLAKVSCAPNAAARQADSLELRAASYAPGNSSDPAWKAVEQWLADYAACVREFGIDQSARRELMDAVNPCYIPRNYLLQRVIEHAQSGDIQPLIDLQNVLRTPYLEQSGQEAFAAKRPEYARHKVGSSMLSCSS